MAALHYAACTTPRGRRFTIEALNQRKPIFLVSYSYVSFPTKPTKRKNYLRRKILKTLPKQLIPELPFSNPTITIAYPAVQDIDEAEIIQEIEELGKSEIAEPGNEEVGILEEPREVKVSLPAGGSVDGNVGRLIKNSILKYGLWLLGVFIFQTVCAVCFFGSTDNENKKSTVLEVGENGNGFPKGRIVLNGDVESVLYVDELEMDRKIEEIRVLAREARVKERLESKKNGFESEENDEIDGGRYAKNGIKDEVENRLIKLRKKLENARDQMPVASVRPLGKIESDNRDRNEALSFKKKYKFKSLLGDSREKPKGFIGSNDECVDQSNENGNLLEEELFRSGENPPQQPDIEPKHSDEVLVVDEDQKKSRVELIESAKSTSKQATRERKMKKQATERNPKEKNNGKSVVATLKSKKLNNEAVKLRGSSTLDTTIVVSNEMSKGNGSLKGKGVCNAKSAAKCESETEFWWLNLPYVLAILMQRGPDGEGGSGLYTLKSSSCRVSHIVAFEDRVDATNFCYLLKSFFEDLEDFEADIAPLRVEELDETVKSLSMRVIVVKRGQLQLYAGQPLADAEMALRSMAMKD